MAKKKRATKVSKGERQSISKKTTHAVRADKSMADKLLNKIKAWKEGKNPWMSFDHLGKFKMNSIYGDPRKRMHTPAGATDGD